MKSKINTHGIIMFSIVILLSSLSYSCSGNKQTTEEGNSETTIEQKEDSIEFKKLENNSQSGIKEKSFVPVSNKSAWDSLYSEIYSYRLNMPDVPEINFKEEMIIGVFMGEQNSGGYEIEVMEITQTSDHIKVYVKDKIPGKTCNTTDVLTQPYTLIIIPKSNKKVFTKSKTEIITCDQE